MQKDGGLESVAERVLVAGELRVSRVVWIEKNLSLMSSLCDFRGSIGGVDGELFVEGSWLESLS